MEDKNVLMEILKNPKFGQTIDNTSLTSSLDVFKLANFHTKVGKLFSNDFFRL